MTQKYSQIKKSERKKNVIKLLKCAIIIDIDVLG